MKAKILAIDADAQRFEKTRALMESQGHRVYGAETSVQGLRMATTLRPDLILLDLGLPQMEGYAHARELRKHHEVGGVPILAMAAHTLLAESEKALAAGCTAYLEPAVAPARFVQQVEQHLSGNQEPPAYQQPEVLSDDSDIEPV